MSSIEPSQSWGIPPVARPRRWQVFFKTGWLPEEGVFTEVGAARTPRGHLHDRGADLGQPSMSYGEQTIEGVARGCCPGGFPMIYRERPAAGEPAGPLVLHHGRGADEHDLLPLGDALDPQRRMHVLTPRAPLTLPGSPGYHWYRVPRVGYPDPESFRAAFAELAAFHDEAWQRTGILPEKTVLGGFSMGAVMSYALALDASRPVPGGILAFSGFIPSVAGLAPRPQQPGRSARVHRTRASRPRDRRRVRASGSRAAARRRPGCRLPRVRVRASHRPPGDPRRG